MGISIHAHIEVKNNGVWYHYAAPAIFRDYRFFEMVGGVYGDNRLPKAASTKGFPKDTTFVTLHAYELDGGPIDCHHVSWMNATEIQKLQDLLDDIALQHKELNNYCLETHYFHTFIAGDPIATHRGWEDVRFIFWFDG